MRMCGQCLVRRVKPYDFHQRTSPDDSSCDTRLPRHLLEFPRDRCVARDGSLSQRARADGVVLEREFCSERGGVWHMAELDKESLLCKVTKLGLRFQGIQCAPRNGPDDKRQPFAEVLEKVRVLCRVICERTSRVCVYDALDLVRGPFFSLAFKAL